MIGSADVRAELILRVLAVDGAEERPGAQIFIAEKFVGLAVQLVGAAFGRDVDHRTQSPAELGAVVVTQDLEFTKELDAGRAIAVRRKIQHIVGRRPVHHQRIAAVPSAVHADVRAARARVIGIDQATLHPRTGAQQLRKVSGRERSAGNLPLLHHLTQSRMLALQQGRCFGNA